MRPEEATLSNTGIKYVKFDAVDIVPRTHVNTNMCFQASFHGRGSSGEFTWFGCIYLGPDFY
jgi:hypothetical protein